MFTYPNLVPYQILSDRGPHMTRSRFGPDLSPGQILGTVYKTKFGPDCGTIRIWPDQIGFVNGAMADALMDAFIINGAV